MFSINQKAVAAILFAVGFAHHVDLAHANDGAASTAAPGAISSNAPLKQIIEGAKKEGRLSLVFGQGSLGDSNSPLFKNFNKYYGLSLDIQVTPGPSMPNMVASTIQQHKANRPSTTDVIIGYANHMINLADAGAIQKGNWTSWAPNILRKEFTDDGEAAVTISSSTPGIAYNSDIFKGDDIPRSLDDLLNPKLKGRVASTPYAASFDQVAAGFWGQEKTLEFAKKFSSQLAGVMRCNEVSRITTGEFDVFGLTCSQGGSLRPASNGAPIGFTLPVDTPIVVYLYSAVPTKAEHPNAAKLFINYLLSREAQDMLYTHDFADLHLLQGSKTAKLIAEVEDRGAKPIFVDTKFYRKNNEKELDSFLAEVQKVFQKR